VHITFLIIGQNFLILVGVYRQILMPSMLLHRPFDNSSSTSLLTIGCMAYEGTIDYLGLKTLGIYHILRKRFCHAYDRSPKQPIPLFEKGDGASFIVNNSHLSADLSKSFLYSPKTCPRK
jgi:hypothetical protein